MIRSMAGPTQESGTHLQDDSVPRRERWAELPGHHEEREVPWDDLPDDADRLMPRIRELRLVRLRAAQLCISREETPSTRTSMTFPWILSAQPA